MTIHWQSRLIDQMRASPTALTALTAEYPSVNDEEKDELSRKGWKATLHKIVILLRGHFNSLFFIQTIFRTNQDAIEDKRVQCAYFRFEINLTHFRRLMIVDRLYPAGHHQRDQRIKDIVDSSKGYLKFIDTAERKYIQEVERLPYLPTFG